LLEAEGLDALLVTSLANIRYLTGFSGSAGLAVLTRADALLVTDFRYDEQARAEAGAVARVEVERTSVWERLFKALATLGPLERVGYEAHALTVKDAERLSQAGRAWAWSPAGEAGGAPAPAQRRQRDRGDSCSRHAGRRRVPPGGRGGAAGPLGARDRGARWSGICGGWAAKAPVSRDRRVGPAIGACRTRRRARGEWRRGSGYC